MRFVFELRLEDGSVRRYSKSTDRIFIGRASVNDLVLTSDLVSAQHALIDGSGVVAVLSDMNSTNGTFLNGNRVVAPSNLKVGDVIAFGIGGSAIAISAWKRKSRPRTMPIRREDLLPQTRMVRVDGLPITTWCSKMRPFRAIMRGSCLIGRGTALSRTCNRRMGSRWAASPIASSAENSALTTSFFSDRPPFRRRNCWRLCPSRLCLPKRLRKRSLQLPVGDRRRRGRHGDLVTPAVSACPPSRADAPGRRRGFGGNDGSQPRTAPSAPPVALATRPARSFTVAPANPGKIAERCQPAIVWIGVKIKEDLTRMQRRGP